MRKLLYFFIGCAIIGLLISFTFSLMPVFPMAGRAVLISISHGNYEEAYAMCSKEFQRNTPIAIFKQSMQQDGLDQYKSVKWLKNVSDLPNKQGYTIGVVTTTDNKRIVVEFDFVQVHGESWLDRGWRINQIRTGGSAEAALF